MKQLQSRRWKNSKRWPKLRSELLSELQRRQSKLKLQQGKNKLEGVLVVVAGGVRACGHLGPCDKRNSVRRRLKLIELNVECHFCNFVVSTYVIHISIELNII